ncbi:MAG: TIM barrel protein [Gaiellaceae bacterium]
MNPVGVCTWIWVSPYSDDDAHLVGHAKELGANVLELCIEDTSRVTPEAVLAAAGGTDMAFSLCGAFGPERDVSHENPKIRRLGLDYIEFLVDLAAGIGAPIVVGPMYSAVGKARMLSAEEREQQRAWAVESLKQAADYAARKGVRLAVEPLNRFETDLVNTAEQALELVARIGYDNVGLLLDTFHMNIEEKSVPDALRLAGDKLFHVHACENDRGTPGTGHIPWPEVFQTLHDIDYRGMLVTESFTPAVQEIAKAVSMWRPLDATGDAMAAKALEFVRAGVLAASPEPAIS